MLSLISLLSPGLYSPGSESVELCHIVLCWVFPCQSNQSRQSLIEMPTGQSYLDQAFLKFPLQVILGCAKMTVKTNQHRTVIFGFHSSSFWGLTKGPRVRLYMKYVAYGSYMHFPYGSLWDRIQGMNTCFGQNSYEVIKIRSNQVRS